MNADIICYHYRSPDGRWHLWSVVDGVENPVGYDEGRAEGEEFSVAREQFYDVEIVTVDAMRYYPVEVK